MALALTRTAGAGLLGWALLSGTAAAHGGFPESTSVLWPPGQGEVPWVQTTFGLLVPVGLDWRWVCEEVVPLADLKTLAIDDAGRWVVGGVYGAQISQGGCSWESPENAVSGLYISQVSLDRGDPSRIFVSTSTADAHNALYATTDGGRTFSEFKSFGGSGAAPTIRGFLQGEGGWPMYAIAWDAGTPSLWYSADGGRWDAHVIEGREDGSVFPLAIDPVNSEVVWLRVDLDNSGSSRYRQRLLRATSGGEFTAILDIEDIITAFAVSPDGATLEVGGRGLGLYRSHDGGQSFDPPELVPEAGCLTWRGGVRYQCANNYSDGAAILEGPASDGATVMVFGQVSGTLSCPGDSDVAAYCEPLWAEVKTIAGLGTIAAPTPTPTYTDVDEGTGCGGCADEGVGPAGLWVVLGVGIWGRRKRS